MWGNLKIFCLIASNHFGAGILKCDNVYGLIAFLWERMLNFQKMYDRLYEAFKNYATVTELQIFGSASHRHRMGVLKITALLSIVGLRLYSVSLKHIAKLLQHLTIA